MSARLKVFVSYSRKDLAFVDELDKRLRERGVEPLIDRAEIYAFEDWWKRIEDLIVQADTIVFVLSPDAVRSEICAREVAFAAELNKRFAPVVARAVDAAEVPAALSRLNFVHLDGTRGFEAGLERLVEALSTDIAWIRRHSEFVELARRWAMAGRPGPHGMLLRPPLLEDAERWISTRPANAPPPTEETQSLILASRRAATRRRQIVSSLLAFGLVLAVLLSGLAVWQRQVAVGNERIAIAARQAEADQRRLAEERERQAVEAADRTLVGQSRFLADLAARSLADGDPGSSILFSLEALPDPSGGNVRPLVPEAERSLDRALSSLAERGLVARHIGRSLAFSPDGHWATSSGGGEQVLFDLATGAMKRTPLSDEILASAFSPDARRLVRCSGTEIQVVDLPDLWTRKLDPAKNGAWPAGSVRSCRFGPDGRNVLAIGGGGRIGWWDAETGVFRHGLALPEGTRGLLSSPDGGRLAVLTSDSVVQVFDAWSGGLTATLSSPGGAVDGVDLSRDGGRILTTSTADGVARVWDVASGSAIVELRTAEATGLLSPDGETVILAGGRNRAGVGDGFSIWDVGTGTKRASIDPALRQTALAFGPDGTSIVAGSPDGSVQVFETPTGRVLARLRGHQARVLSAALSPDGRKVLSSGFDSRLVLWNLDSARSSRTFQAARAAVTAVLPSEDGQTLTVGSRDGSLRGWPVEQGQTERTILPEGGPPLVSIGFAPGTRRLLALRQDGTATLLDSVTGATVAIFAGAVASGSPDGVSADNLFSTGGDRFVIRSGPGDVSLRRSEDGGEIWRSPATLDGRGGVLLTPDGTRVLAWSGRGTAEILDGSTGARIATLRNTPLTPDGSPVPGGAADETLPWSTFSVSPDGSRLVTDGPFQPRIWSLATGETERILFEHAISGDRVLMRFGPDPDILFTTEAGRKVAAWDLASGNRILSFVGHGRTITSLRVSPDGTRLLTASEDGTARIWDVASGVDLVSLEGRHGPIFDARFWPGQGVVTAAGDGAVTLWPIARDARALVGQAKEAISRCLTPSQRARAFLDPAPPAWCVTGPGLEHEVDPQRWQPRPPYQTPIWGRWYRAKQTGSPIVLPRMD